MLAKKIMYMMFLTGMAVQAAPIFNIFELGVKNGQETAYNSVGENNITKSVLGEKGTLAMYSVRQKENPNMTYMFEVYSDDESYKIHANSVQYKDFLSQSPAILTDHKKKIEVVPEYLGDKKFTQTKDIRTNYVTVDVKNGQNEKFIKIVMEEMIESVQKEAGVYAIYAATSKDNPNRWHFFEIYENEEAYQKHRKTPHFKKYLSETADMLEDKSFVDIEAVKLLNKGNLNYIK